MQVFLTSGIDLNNLINVLTDFIFFIVWVVWVLICIAVKNIGMELFSKCPLHLLPWRTLSIYSEINKFKINKALTCQKYQKHNEKI